MVYKGIEIKGTMVNKCGIESCKMCGYIDQIDSFKTIKNRLVADTFAIKSSIEYFATLQCPKCSSKFEVQL